jgi:hypothetical protein
VHKKKIYSCVHERALDGKDCEGKESLRWFGSLEGTDDARSNQTKLGMLLRTFKGRILAGIRLSIDESSLKSQQHRYRFTRLEQDPSPHFETTPGEAAEKDADCRVIPQNSAQDRTLSLYSDDFLALDIETYSKVYGSKTGALSPQRGDIRPLSRPFWTPNVMDVSMRPSTR